MTKPLTKVWKCPTCNVGFKASQSIEGGRPGRRCPAGHFHSQYELKRHEEGKPIRTGWRNLIKGEHYGEQPMVKVPRSYSNDKVEMLALLWVGAMDALLAQLPERSVARAMVEGATAQAYRVSQQMLQPKEERKVA